MRFNLIQIFLLNFVPGQTESAGCVALFHKQQLINDYVVSIDSAFGQFLDQSLRLVEGQKFRYTNANKSRLFGISKLLIHLSYNVQHLLHFVGKFIDVEIASAEQRTQLQNQLDSLLTPERIALSFSFSLSLSLSFHLRDQRTDFRLESH